ncbi:hypothetical protein DACRYDRAFT_21758 [Dacryopinax primogenitus]|uniref:Uncharacterized protein n=1 Tax=Dacryopinax primogenitus (strain DJM 731) TaxID=1858805 RepID=M5G286_DACPD|nr:uncharacterized protein DACRYDRAFT_21758 [Dacryopinax primogenitus]EJU02804.1 hypothetical protein DACRYDRAFT_21758 [Dacryopinax primogenitus]
MTRSKSVTSLTPQNRTRSSGLNEERSIGILGTAYGGYACGRKRGDVDLDPACSGSDIPAALELALPTKASGWKG